MLPYDNNRVKMVRCFGHTDSDYINASFIEGRMLKEKYIAAPGPLLSTMQDFWKMICEQKSMIIVMLGDLIIKGDVMCDKYWPNNTDPITSFDMTLHMIEESAKDHWIERKIVINYDGKSRTVTQYHFTAWDDDEFNKNQIQSLVRFVSSIRIEINISPQPGPIVVHCSNGCGRTGTFIAIDRLLQQLKENSSMNISDTVRQLRENRISMVENRLKMINLRKRCLNRRLYKLCNTGLQTGNHTLYSVETFRRRSNAHCMQ